MRRWPVSLCHGTRSLKSRWAFSPSRNFGALAQHVPKEKVSAPPPPVSPLAVEALPKIDPFALIFDDLHQIQSNLLELLGSAHPELRDMAEYYFLTPSRQLRPIVVLLISRATNGLGRMWSSKCLHSFREKESNKSEEYDRPLAQPGVLASWDVTMPNDRESFQDVFSLRMPHSFSTPPLPTSPASLLHVSQPSLLPTQIRLAQIVEMINIASILHDSIPTTGNDVDAPGKCQKNTKLAILGGDFLLGRASSALSRLGEAEVIELIASVISNLSEGEIIQLPRASLPALGAVTLPREVETAWSLYFKRTYMKTASLLAKGARSAAVLAGSSRDDVAKDAAYSYGRHLGFAHQITQDLVRLNENIDARNLPFPTAPLLFAWEVFPALGSIFQRNLMEPEDPDSVKVFLQQSAAIEKTKALASRHARKARQSLNPLVDSPEKAALQTLTHLVIDQNWQ